MNFWRMRGFWSSVSQPDELPSRKAFKLNGAATCDVLYLQYPNVDYYPPTINGLRVMAEHGLRVKALCWSDWPPTGVAYPDRVQITRLPGKPAGGCKGPLYLFKFISKAFRLARSHRPAVIYGSNLQGIVAAGLIGEALGIPYVHHCYDLYLPTEGMGHFSKCLKPLEKLFSKRAQLLIFPSLSKSQLFLKTSGLTRECTVVANAPRRQPARRTDALRRAIRRLGGDGGLIVLYQGSIGPTCGVENLIRSIPQWPDKAVLALLGIARPPDFMNHLHECARQLGVQDRVFYLGVVSYDDLLDLTASADLGVFLPTKAQSNYVHSGTAVNKIMEYMACGVPSLVATFPALEALMAETQAGTVVDPADPRVLGQKVSQMLTDRGGRESYARNARKAHIQQYNFERQFTPVLDAINRLTQRRVTKWAC